MISFPLRVSILSSVLAWFIALSTSAFAESVAPNVAKTKEPPTSWIDLDTGHRIIRLTNEPVSANLYFNNNCFTLDGRQMIYVTRDGISALDLTTFKTKQVVEGMIKAIAVGQKTPCVFYTKIKDPALKPPAQISTLYAANLDTGEIRKLADLPSRSKVFSINADETLAAGTYIEGEQEDVTITTPEPGQHKQQKRKADLMEERLAAQIPTTMFVIDLRSGKTQDILKTTDWLGHLLFSPTDPTLIMYCHEGPWQKVDRIWTIRSDGTQNTLIHNRTMEMEIAGHEFWSHDGKTIWYDLQTPRSEVFWVAGYNVETGERTRYSLQRDEWSVHFNVSNDGKLFCGDGGDPGKIAHAPDGRWIYLLRPELTKETMTVDGTQIRRGVFHSERLVGMFKHDYMSEPNVRFTPDQKYVIFRSNMLGPSYVFAVEVAQSKPDIK